MSHIQSRVDDLVSNIRNLGEFGSTRKLYEETLQKLLLWIEDQEVNCNPENCSSQIGASIKLIRFSLGLCQKDVCEKCDPPIGQGTLSKIEKEEMCPSIKVLLTICKALRISVNDVLKLATALYVLEEKCDETELLAEISGQPVEAVVSH